MAIVHKKRLSPKRVRKARSTSAKARRLTSSASKPENEKRIMASQGLLAADSVFCMYDEAESNARAKG
jgi:hypothetical protein